MPVLILHLASCKFIWLNWLQLAIPLHHFTVVSWIINSGNKSTKNTKYVSSLFDMTKLIAVFQQYILAPHFYTRSFYYCILIVIEFYYIEIKIRCTYFMHTRPNLLSARNLFVWKNRANFYFEQYDMHFICQVVSVATTTMIISLWTVL